MPGYNKGQQKLAELKLKKELAKPERIEKEAEFAAIHREDTDAELIEYIAALKIKQGINRFNRYQFIGYCYVTERFGSWSKMMGLVNERIREIRSEC